MNILYLSPTGAMGGAEKVLLAVMSAVRRLSPTARLSLVCLSDGPLVEQAQRAGIEAAVEHLPSELANLGDSRVRQEGMRSLVPLVREGFRAAPRIAGFVRRLRHRIARLDPHLIHSNGIKTHCLSPWVRNRSASLVWHVHDFVSSRPLSRRLLAWAGKRVASAIAISGAVADNLRNVCPRTPIWVVPNTVNVQDFSPGENVGDRLDRLAGLPVVGPGMLRIGLLATYARWKGHAVFLEAIARYVHSGAPPARFYIIGGPIYQTQGSQFSRRELQQFASRHRVADHVGFIDFQQDVVSAYRSLDIVIHASTQPEPFGLTIIEAMACGKAVVATQAGGAAEIFQPGHDALGVSPGNVQAMTDALVLLARTPALRHRLGVNARATACSRFNQDRLPEQISDIYQHVLPNTYVLRAINRWSTPDLHTTSVASFTCFERSST